MNGIRYMAALLAASMMLALFGMAGGVWAGDVKGSHDHPMVGRFPGSVITHYSQKQFDEASLIVGPVKDGKFSATKELEGKVTMIRYAGSRDHAPLEVYRSYKDALAGAGFKTLFECAKDACGPGFVTRQITGFDGGKDPGRNPILQGGNPRYIAARLVRPEGDVYVSLMVFENNSGLFTWFNGIGFVRLTVVEVKPMKANLVKVDAEALHKDITNTGHAAVYGIYFDTDSATIKPGSEAAMGEIAKMLKQSPGLRVILVGHTDSQGGFNHNMELSQRRAKAVMASLIADYGIARGRLDAAGVGYLAPVAPNATEEGRARNRRVEIVAP